LKKAFKKGGQEKRQEKAIKKAAMAGDENGGGNGGVGRGDECMVRKEERKGFKKGDENVMQFRKAG
jgi:hypothetical protein